jgi:cell division protein FtsN
LILLHMKMYYFRWINKRLSMIIKNSIIIGTVLFAAYLVGCSSSQQVQTEDTGKDSVYVFDSVPDTAQTEVPALEYPDLGMTYYIVQIGAFTTKERAQNFAEESKQLLPFDVKISFSRQNNLYVVQLSDYYTSRTEAESVRNDLWKKEKFRDAWILTIYK